MLQTLEQLWRQEQQSTEARFREERRGRSLEARVERGIALEDLAVQETGAAPGGRIRLFLATEAPVPASIDDVRIGPGDPVTLWRHDPDDPQDAVEAVVSRWDGERLVVLVEGEALEALEDPGFRLDLAAPQATFERGARAIARFRDAPDRSDTGRLREVLFGDAEPRVDAEHEPSLFDEGLNEPQRAAVRLALAARDVALVHGPPGTGKTRTLVEVVRQAVKRGERVLVSAASNTAVDNLAERLAADLEVVRLGHPARVSDAMEARTLDVLVQGTEQHSLARRWMAEANELRRRVHQRSARGRLDRRERRQALSEAWRLVKDARRQLASVQDAVLSRCHAVCATAAGADTRLLGDARFDVVVIDEATQAPDPIALVALARGARAVLAGDPHQLPPTVIDVEAARAGLGTTLFERIADRYGERAVRMLEVQHRMHEVLMRFPSESMYEGRLRAAPEVARHRLEDLEGVSVDPLRPGPLVFVDTAGKGWHDERGPDDPSSRNPAQADRVAAETRRILRRGLPPGELAVITPYEAQARLLRERLAEPRAAGLEIGTVDGFQGREKEAVVVDLVRSNDDGEVGFLADTRRMNVALTRARRLLVVVGDSATLGAHPYYASFLEAASDADAWISAWTDDPDVESFA